MQAAHMPWANLSEAQQTASKLVEMHEADVPTKQRAAIFDQRDGKIEIREVDVPTIEHDEILVRILYAGVCQNDLHLWKGDMLMRSEPKETILGHEGVGIVVQVGDGVSTIKVGDRAGIKWINGACFNCEFCERGFESNCPAVQISGLSRPGVFCEFVAAKAAGTTIIPNTADLATATQILCAGLTVYRGLKEANVQPGQFVAISGAGGGLGKLAIQYARELGMRPIAIDSSEHEAACREMGAELFVDTLRSDDVFPELVFVTDGGPHGVLNLAPSMEAIERSFEYVRPHGTAVIISLLNGRFSADLPTAVTKCIQIKGSFGGNRRDADEAMGFFARDRIHCPIELVPFEQIGEVFGRMEKGDVDNRVVLDLRSEGLKQMGI